MFTNTAYPQYSNFNAHLFSLRVVDSPQCICGYDVEGSEYFLLNCPLYLLQIQEMLQKLNKLNIANVELETMLFHGCNVYEFGTNQRLYNAVCVHEFISTRL